MEGQLTFWVGGDVIAAPAGSFVYGPSDIPHTFVVSSAQARFLLVAEPGGFERFMRAAGRPAAALTIPPPEAPPPDLAPLVALAAEHGIEILGPPGIPTA
jgi:quercetin dioxygenase-like cupin family protein